MDRLPVQPPTHDDPTSDPADGGSRSRDSLLLMAQLRSPALTGVFAVRIRNLSSGGLMAEFASPLERDTPVEVEVRGIGWVPGRVAWFTEGRTGIAFNVPIDPQRARKPVKPVRAPGPRPAAGR